MFRLRKVGSLPHIAESLPTLNALLPFLEVSQDQEYLVSRLKVQREGSLFMSRSVLLRRKLNNSNYCTYL